MTLAFPVRRHVQGWTPAVQQRALAAIERALQRHQKAKR